MEFRLSSTDEQGISQRAHIEKRLETAEAAGMDGILSAALEELDQPDFPDDLDYLWEWFLELHSARQSGGFGAAPISYLEMEAWSRLTDRELRDWEARAIRTLDGMFLSQARKSRHTQ